MLKNKHRIIIAAIALACTALVSCGSDTAPAESKAETTTTTTSAEKEVISDIEKADETTTTTTTADTTSETEITEPTTTTTTEVIESSEPETDESEAEKEDAVVITDIEPMEDNPDGMYPLVECIRRRVEEIYGQKVISVSITEYNDILLTLESGKKGWIIPGADVELDYNKYYSLYNFVKAVGMESEEYPVVLNLNV
ncbi:MAG: hypothetical protein E7493_03460 [Ruminococcus albus]|nr:hypothetical protein [Ruminococcus albus]